MVLPANLYVTDQVFFLSEKLTFATSLLQRLFKSCPVHWCGTSPAKCNNLITAFIKKGSLLKKAKLLY